MGLLGLFVGPVLMALIVAISREWMRDIQTAAPVTPAPPADAALSTNVHPAAPRPTGSA